MLLQNFRPKSKLVTKTTPVDRPKFPVVDVHGHAPGLGSAEGVNRVVAAEALDTEIASLARSIIDSNTPLQEVQAFTESRVPLMPRFNSAADWTRIADHLRKLRGGVVTGAHHHAHQDTLRELLFGEPLGAVAGDYMADFMPQYSGYFAFGLQQPQETFGDEDRPAGQSEGVNFFRIENRHFERHFEV